MKKAEENGVSDDNGVDPPVNGDPAGSPRGVEDVVPKVMVFNLNNNTAKVHF